MEFALILLHFGKHFLSTLFIYSSSSFVSLFLFSFFFSSVINIGKKGILHIDVMVLADLIELEFDTPAALPNLGFYKVVLHFAQIFFAFLTFCTVVHVISIEGHYTVSINYSNII